MIRPSFCTVWCDARATICCAVLAALAKVCFSARPRLSSGANASSLRGSLSPIMTTTGSRFKNIITAAYQRTGKGVVILVDDYDKPLVSNIDNEAQKEEFRNILKPIYANLKGCDRYIRLAILTGVSRFSRLSIFSDLNNLRDISFSEQYAAVCGITEQEMLDNCRVGIQALANKTGVSYDEADQNLKTTKHGYQFTRNCTDI